MSSSPLVILAVAHLLTTNRQPLSPYGEVKNGQLDDESALTPYSEEQRAEMTVKIAEEAHQNDQEVLRRIREEISSRLDKKKPAQ